MDSVGLARLTEFTATLSVGLWGSLKWTVWAFGFHLKWTVKRVDFGASKRERQDKRKSRPRKCRPPG